MAAGAIKVTRMKASRKRHVKVPTLAAFARGVQDYVNEVARKRVKSQGDDIQEFAVPVKFLVHFETGTAGLRNVACCRCWISDDGKVFCMGSCCPGGP